MSLEKRKELYIWHDKNDKDTFLIGNRACGSWNALLRLDCNAMEMLIDGLNLYDKISDYPTPVNVTLEFIGDYDE